MRPLAAALLVLAALAAGVFQALRDTPPRPPEGRSAPAAGDARTGGDAVAAEAAWPDRAATPEDVRAIVRRGRGAGAGDIPALRGAALGATDPLVAGNAIRALGRLDAVAGDPALLGLMRDARLRVRQEVVLALGRSRQASAAGHLEDALRSGGPELRPLAIHGLSAIDSDAARAATRVLRTAPAR